MVTYGSSIIEGVDLIVSFAPVAVIICLCIVIEFVSADVSLTGMVQHKMAKTFISINTSKRTLYSIHQMNTKKKPCGKF